MNLQKLLLVSDNDFTNYHTNKYFTEIAQKNQVINTINAFLNIGYTLVTKNLVENIQSSETNNDQNIIVSLIHKDLSVDDIKLFSELFKNEDVNSKYVSYVLSSTTIHDGKNTKRTEGTIYRNSKRIYVTSENMKQEFIQKFNLLKVSKQVQVMVLPTFDKLSFDVTAKNILSRQTMSVDYSTNSYTFKNAGFLFLAIKNLNFNFNIYFNKLKTYDELKWLTLGQVDSYGVKRIHKDSNVIYKGNAKYGLVWHGEKLINNELTLKEMNNLQILDEEIVQYLQNFQPIIIQTENAFATTVKKYKIGIVSDDLMNTSHDIAKIDKTQYFEMINNIRTFNFLILNNYFIKQVDQNIMDYYVSTNIF